MNYLSMMFVLSLLMLIFIGKGVGEEAWSERYVFIKSTSLSQLHLKMCDSNDNIKTCGTWSYPSSYNGTSHFYLRSVNKGNDSQGIIFLMTCAWKKYSSNVYIIAVPSNFQSFFQTWNEYKCYCYPQTPTKDTGLWIVIGIQGVLLLFCIVLTVGWTWTCKIAIKRGKLIKKKGESMGC